VRGFLPVLPGLWLAACAGGGGASLTPTATPPPTEEASLTPAAPAPSAAPSAWTINRKIDRITGQPAPSAHVITTKTSRSGRHLLGGVAVELLCFEKKPVVKVIFSLRAGANRNSTFAYRFDEKPGREIKATFLQDHKTVVIDQNAELAQFLNELATSNTLFVRVTSLFAGNSAAEFRVHGGKQAIDAVVSECPIKSEPGRKRA
jgi:hypothetical protein